MKNVKLWVCSQQDNPLGKLLLCLGTLKVPCPGCCNALTQHNQSVIGDVLVVRGQQGNKTGVNISDQTVRNRFRAENLRLRRPAVRTTLTQRHRRARRDWCHQHIQWTRQQWSRVLFSDESLFNLHFNDGIKRVYRRQGERFSDATVSEYDRFGGGSVMV